MLWDVSLRLYHWLFAITLSLSYLTGEIDALQWHEKLGITMLALLTYRFIWAFIGPEPARLSTMLRTLRLIIPYLKSPSDVSLPAGHNPLGVLSVLAFWSIASLMAVSGLFNYDDVLFEGPLYSWQPTWGPLASAIHDAANNLILPLIGLHLAAIFWHQIIRRNLIVQRMVFGIRADTTHIPSQTHQALGIVILTLSLSGSWLFLG